MNKQKRLLILSVALVLLVAGASVLYNYLGDRVQQDMFAEQENDNEELVSKEESSDGENTDEQDSEEPDSENDTTKENEPSLDPAKDITVTDIDGNEISLSDFKGKPVVLNFWTSWCSICKNEMMDFQMAYDQYNEDVVFMMVSVTDDSRETVKKAFKYIEGKGYTFPVYYDTLREGYFAYNIMSVPVTYFIDADGNIAMKIKGGVDRVILDRGIAKLYSEQG